ncbi:MAG: hypothetical protein U9N32_05325 [Spirochaetota bacterium]|nr:hypothetical protein [Spirochaetota bacterium]
MVFRIILFFCFIISAASVSAQQNTLDENETVTAQFIAPAVLVRGPVESSGFPLIYPNAIKTWIGYYRYLELEVVVSFTRKNIMISGEWENKVCNKAEGYSPDNKSFFYNNDDWSLLFQFSDQDFVDCDFISIFIIRLKYFLRDVSPLSPPLLPAILEIR